jgi:hypothetical protein
MKMRIFWDTAQCNLVGVDISEVRTASIIRVMEAEHTSETSVYSNETTLRCIPEGSHLLQHLCAMFSVAVRGYTKRCLTDKGLFYKPT